MSDAKHLAVAEGLSTARWRIKLVDIYLGCCLPCCCDAHSIAEAGEGDPGGGGGGGSVRKKNKTKRQRASSVEVEIDLSGVEVEEF